MLKLNCEGALSKHVFEIKCENVIKSTTFRFVDQSFPENLNTCCFLVLSILEPQRFCQKGPKYSYRDTIIVIILKACIFKTNQKNQFQFSGNAYDDTLFMFQM